MSPRHVLSRSRSGVMVVAAFAALVGLSVTVAGAASAHVSVYSHDATPGGYGKFTFRVPNESDTASTVSLRVELPTDTPLSSLRAQPVPGWTSSVTKGELERPAEINGEKITEAVTVVEYTAEEGAGVAPGQFQEFSLSGGPFPETDELVFSVAQTYSDGRTVVWEEVADEGQEPQNPAPVLSLTGNGTGGHGASADDAEAASLGQPEIADGEDSGMVTVALAVGALGVFVGLGALAVAWGARRRIASA